MYNPIVFTMSVVICMITFFKIFNAAFLGIFENITTWSMIDATAILFMNDFILNASSLMNEQRKLLDSSGHTKDMASTNSASVVSKSRPEN